MSTLEIKIVPAADGSLDVDATIAAAEDTIRNYAMQRSTEDDTILDSLNQVFDRLKENGTRANMPYIIGQTLALLGVGETPSAYTVMHDRVHKFIQANSQGKLLDKDTKTVERPNSLFVVGKGKGGGLFRRSDLTPAAAEQA